METALRRADYDLEAVEVAVRSAALGQACQALGGFMSAVGRSVSGEPVECPRCRNVMEGTGPRTKTILTLLGPVTYTRSRYRCPECGAVRYPGDEALDVVRTSRSPGVCRQTARLGAKEPFREVAKDLEELAGIVLSRKDAERISEGAGEDLETRDQRERERTRFVQPPAPEIPKTIEDFYLEMDGTGVPVVAWETEDRKGKKPGEPSGTREAKLGCVFTRTTTDHEGRPLRDPESTSYTGAIEEVGPFGWRMYAEAVRRGLYTAKRVVVLGDAAAWITSIAQDHFPMALHIVDFYHASEHLTTLTNALFSNPNDATDHRERWKEFLVQGSIEQIIEQARAYLPRNPDANKDARREVNFLDKHKEKMRYARFRQQGLFIGSGVIEAGCKTVVCHRLKQSGMEWTVNGANAIIALRCAILSNRFQDYWDARSA